MGSLYMIINSLYRDTEHTTGQIESGGQGFSRVTVHNCCAQWSTLFSLQ